MYACISMYVVCMHVSRNWCSNFDCYASVPHLHVRLPGVVAIAICLLVGIYVPAGVCLLTPGQTKWVSCLHLRLCLNRSLCLNRF